MKTIILMLAFLIAENAYCAIDTIQAKSKITDVTVFFTGAQITRNVDLKANKGKHLILLDKLPQEINPQSIQVKGLDNCKILSVKHQFSYQNENKKSKEATEIENTIESKAQKIKEIKNKIGVFELEEKLMLDNSMLAKKDDGSGIKEIKEAVDFYRLRLNEIRQSKLELLNMLDAENKKIQENYLQLNELTSKMHKTYSQIMIALDCEKDVTASLGLSYYIASAGWTPLYDFRVDEITKPLVIVYNANVYQSSGEDWNNIKITLSTNNPSLSGNKPELLTWYVDRKNPYIQEPVRTGNQTGALKGVVQDLLTTEAIPFANIVVMAGNQSIAGATTDFDGRYTIKPVPPGKYTLKVTYMGYKTVQINGVQVNYDKITFLDFRMEATSVSLSEVVITDYKVPLISKDRVWTGGTVTSEEISRMPNRSADAVVGSVRGVYRNDDYLVRGMRREAADDYQDALYPVKVETNNYIANTFRTTLTNLEYAIEIPYSIPSDGEDYALKIKDVTLPVNYCYHAVPKLDKDVFLTAEIENWTELNLLSGKSSIYYQGTFTGQSQIDATQASDTLRISLGRDRNIIVSREGNKKMADKRTSGNYVKETLGWDITVKNNKNAPIRIVVEEQYPISQRKSIEVELLESSNAKIDEKKGRLSWELDLPANDKKVLVNKYSVRYPRELNLVVE